MMTTQRKFGDWLAATFLFAALAVALAIVVFFFLAVLVGW